MLRVYDNEYVHSVEVGGVCDEFMLKKNKGVVPKKQGMFLSLLWVEIIM